MRLALNFSTVCFTRLIGASMAALVSAARAPMRCSRRASPSRSLSASSLPSRLFQPDSRAVYGDAGEAHDALAIPMYCDGNAVRVEFTYRRETYCAARIAEFRDLFVETLVGLAGA